MSIESQPRRRPPIGSPTVQVRPAASNCLPPRCQALGQASLRDNPSGSPRGGSFRRYAMPMDRHRLWQRLRSLRAKPPGLASEGDRRHTFTAALEQAEQLLRSAESLGPETRPLAIFYGLSQGTRAVAAATIPDSRAWHLRGHGITHAGSLNRPIDRIRVVNDSSDRGSFHAIAEMLQSPSLPTAVEFGDILAALPMQFSQTSWTNRPRSILVEHLSQTNGAYLLSSPHIYARTRGWVPIELPASLEGTRESIVEYVNRNYPTLAGIKPIPDGNVRLQRTNEDLAMVVGFESDQHLGSEAARCRYLEDRTTEVSGQRFALPAFTGYPEPCHPTVVLWATLWVLSMLARYEPVRWSKSIDVDHNADGTALEEILDDALDWVPWCLLDALAPSLPDPNAAREVSS